MKTNERLYYFDFLRILSVIAVIMLHVSVENWSDINVRSFDWNVMNFYRSISSFGVPVFVMISGALFLERKNTVRKLYNKNIKRIAVSFIFWSFVYAIYNFISFKRMDVFINSFLSGNNHMWFLFMIVGLYMIIPLLEPIAESTKRTRYFLLLFLVFAIAFPQIIQIMKYKFAGLAEIFQNDLSNFNIYFVLGYTGYFILGHYLNTTEISRKKRCILYSFGIVGAIATVFLTRFASYHDNKANGDFYNVFSINVILIVVSIFVFFKNTIDQQRLKNGFKIILITLSKCTFGAYLVHMLVLNIMVDYLKIDTISFNPIISIPVITIVIASISFLISYLISKIPIVNKYIV